MSVGKTVAKAAGVIVIMNLLSRILGFARDVAVANAFGASGATDAYMVAYNIPFLVQAVLGGALMTAIVPVFTEYTVKEDKAQAWKVVSIVFNLTVLVLVVVSVFGMWQAPLFVKLLAPGFKGEIAQIAAQLTAIMFPAIIFMGVGMLFNGVLNAGGYFGIPSMTTGFSNVVILLTVLLFTDTYGIQGLAVGTLVSMFGFLLIQVPVLKKMGWQYSFAFDYHHPGVKTVAQEIVPIILGVSVNQIYLTLNSVFASGLGEGSISALNYANKLIQLPLGVFVVAVSTAIFPTLTTQSIKGDFEAMGQTLMKGLKMVALITIPAAVGLIVLQTPIVRLLFQRGAFDAQDTLMTAAAVMAFSVGLFAQAANLVITRAYYAQHRVMIPVVMSLISIVVNVALSYAFVQFLVPSYPLYGHAFLALANSLAAAVNTLLLYKYLHEFLPDLHKHRLLGTLAKIGVVSMAMAAVVYGADLVLAGFFQPFGSKGLLVEVGLAVSLGLLVYFAGVLLLKVEEVTTILQMVKARFTRRLSYEQK